jgi:Dyp-type peroxidase family
MVQGVETSQKAYIRILKCNIASNDTQTAVTALRGIASQLCSFAVSFPHSDPRDTLSVVVGFSARFFKGELTRQRDAQPGATRFSIRYPAPSCLRRMCARHDDLFSELSADNDIREKESDLIILVESDEDAAGQSLCDRLRSLACVGLRPLQQYRGCYGLRLLGIQDGLSNLQDLRLREPNSYKDHVFVHNGESGSDIYDGGTYLVFRKYRINLGRWFNPEFHVSDCRRHIVGDKARELILGRSATDQQVVDYQTGKHWEPQFDHEEALHAWQCSHIRKANPRSVGFTSFNDPVTLPAKRILRRSFEYREETEAGLLFLCFQNDIQRNGFEFIHNEWLMSHFMGRRDPLLDPESQLVEPIDGCYYFVPRFTDFPGDIFWS